MNDAMDDAMDDATHDDREHELGEDAPPDEGSARPWWRRPRWIALLAALAILVIGGTVFGLAWSRRGAEQASVEEAVEGLDRDARDGEGDFLRPATGVYVYAGEGTEQLSVLDTTQQWGPELPAVVERDGSRCWTFTIEYNTHHEQSTTWCPNGDVLEEAGGSTFQSFDFVVTTVEDRTTFVCAPPGETIRVRAEPGSTWRQSCDGGSAQQGTHVTSAGTNTFVRVDTVDVGGESVRAFHYRVKRTLTGDQSGEEVVDTWYRTRDGLPLRVERDAKVDSPSPVGTVTYVERGTYRLTSVEPRR
jgi:hypothetical protein